MDLNNTQTHSTQVEAPIQQQSILSKKNSSKKIFWIFFFAAILIAFGAGGYLLGANKNKPQPVAPKVSVAPSVNPTSDPTADWQIYKNEKYGYEIKHPYDWTSLDKGLAVTFDYNNLSTRETALFQIGKNQIAVVENGDIKIAEKEINQIVSNAKTILKSKSAVKVGNYDGYEMIGTFCTRICTGSSEDIYTPFSYIYFSEGKKVVQINYSEGIRGVGSKGNINDWKYYAIYKQILSTFKFTN